MAEEKLDMDLDEIVARRRSGPSPHVKASRASRRNKSSPYGQRGGAGSGSGAKLYVGNLAFSTSWQALKDHMRKVGPVVRVDIMENADGRSKGFGIVEFANANAARKAISQLNGTTLDGRDIVVREDRDASKAKPKMAPRAARPARSAAVAPLSFGGFAKGPVRLFVGNLDWRVQWFNLKDAFAEAGEVTYANVITGQDGRSKGFGIVEMANAKDAQRAIDMYNGKDMDGRVVQVRFDRRSKATASSNRVFVGNLSYSVTWMDLKDHFRAAGNVTHATVFKDGTRSKGCGLVEFANEHDAQAAIERLNDSFLKGRVMFVSEDTGASSGQGAGGAGAGAGGASAARRSTAPTTVTSKTNRVYVGNLSWKVTWGELKDTFRQWGEVAFAKVATEDNGRSRGWGIVEYTNKEDAARAIDHANGIYMDGRRMYVREDERDFELAAAE